MNEQPVVVEEEAQEIDYKSFYEQHKETVDKLPGLVNKNRELLAETKQAKEDRTRAATEAKRIADEKAIKDGEYEKLWKTAKEEKESLANQINELKNTNRKEKIQISALKISNELAEGDNVELLSDFVMRNLDVLADESGSLSEEILADVKKQFESNSKYNSLLKQSKASGGSAPGNTRGALSNTTITRGDFAKMTPQKQFDFTQKMKVGQASLTE